jgi:hypothetical protein
MREWISVKMKPIFLMICILTAVCLSGCREESDETAILDSEPVEKVSMQGTEGKFEIVKVNGTSEEPHSRLERAGIMRSIFQMTRLRLTEKSIV